MCTKKELNESLKQILQEDEVFREAYNKLSDEDKENIKKRHLEGIKLHNLVVANHTPHVMDDLEKEAQSQLREHLLAKGFKKVYGKKSKIYTTGRSFVFRVGKYLVAIKPNQYFKKGMNCSYLILLEISTERGKVYVDLRDGGNFCTKEDDLMFAAYTAHFFDRYEERLGLEGGREDIVKKFMRTELKAIKKGSSLEYEHEKVIYNLSNGLALGTTSGNGILLKTFISENEINSFQERKKQELDEMMRLNDLEFL